MKTIRISINEIIKRGYPCPPGEVQQPIYSRTIECESSEAIVIAVAQLDGKRAASNMGDKE